jgi:hypothetical protein
MKVRWTWLALVALSTGCSEDRAEESCAKVYDECGLVWQVPDKSFSRDECVTQLDQNSRTEDDAARTEEIFDCVESATCDTALDCFNN